MLVEKNLTKEILNSIRIFEKLLTPGKIRLLRYFMTSVIKQKTLVISHLFDENKTSSSKKKFVEKISNMLASIPDISQIVKKQTVRLINNYSDNNIKIISYDWTDIAKPKSKKLPLLSWIFDPSSKSFYK